MMPGKPRLRITLEMLDPDLIAKNPRGVKEVFEVEGAVMFSFNEKGEGISVGTRAIGLVNHGGMAQGLVSLPFGHSVVSKAMVLECMGMGADDHDEKPDEPDEPEGDQDEPMEGAPALAALLKQLGIIND